MKVIGEMMQEILMMEPMMHIAYVEDHVTLPRSTLRTCFRSSALFPQSNELHKRHNRTMNTNFTVCLEINVSWTN